MKITKVKNSSFFLMAFFAIHISVKAQWSGDPNINTPIAVAPGAQEEHVTISDGYGGAIIAWTDFSPGTHYDIRAQRVNASGDTLWKANGVLVATAPGSFFRFPEMASDGNGGAIITWDHDGNFIYAQRIDANGNALWTPPGIIIYNGSGIGFDFDIVDDGSGGAIVTWEDNRNVTTRPDLFAQKINSNGILQWGPSGIAVCTALSVQDVPKITSDGTGGTIITWEDYRIGGQFDIYAQHLAQNGTVLWINNGIPICIAPNHQRGPKLVSDGSGGAILTWQDYRNGSNWNLYTQRVNANGDTLWPANGVLVKISPYQHRPPDIIRNGNGGAIITWSEYSGGNGTNDDVYSQRINPGGLIQWGPTGMAISTAAGDQNNPKIISDDSGGGIISWFDGDIHAQRVDSSGLFLWGINGAPISTASNGQYNSELVSDGSGGAVITWEDSRNGNSDIFASRVNSAGALLDFIPPAIPQNLMAIAGNGQVSLNWNQNSESDFSHYRIYGGNSPNPSTQIDSTTGGTITINGLTNGLIYYFRVSAVDNSGNQSGFSNEVTATLSLFSDVAIGLMSVTSGSVAWGDYDNDGDLDILLTGTIDGGGLATSGGFTKISKIYRNDNGIFVDINAGLEGVSLGSAAWGDYDNDGDLDVLLTGAITGEVTTLISKVYRNDAGNFVDISAGLPGVYFSAVAWGDYDNDGDLDILLTGDTKSELISKIYRNDNGFFSADTAAALPGIYDGSVAWGDYDKDGDLDILITGSPCGLDCSYLARIYRNEGGGVFTDINAGLAGVYRSSGEWGDFNNDGYLDILFSGASGGGKTLKIYQNNGDGTFTDVTSPNFAPLSRTSVAWGDYDNDGDLDILTAGVSDSVGYKKSVLYVYRNNGGGSFTKADSTLTGVADASVAWGDFDNDGKLDILATGYNIQSLLPYSILYRNLSPTVNTQPGTPPNLLSLVTANSVTLQWNPAADAETPANGLTYNIRIGTTSNGVQKVSPLANVSTGFRHVPKLGNTNHKTSWKIDNLSEGTYYWSAQAIDNAFAGSGFAPQRTFVVDTTAPSSPAITINSGAIYTNTTAVTLTLSAVGADSIKITGNVMGGNVNKYIAYSTSANVTLTTGDGTKTVSVVYKDGSGNISSPASDDIVLDTAGPISPTISINSGAAVTNSTSVTLTLSASGADSMKLSGDIVGENIYVAFGTSTNVTLTSVDGTKTVSVIYKDLAGNTITANANILLDTGPPTSPSIVINNGAAATNNVNVILTLSASGADSMIITGNVTGSNVNKYIVYSTSAS